MEIGKNRISDPSGLWVEQSVHDLLENMNGDELWTPYDRKVHRRLSGVHRVTFLSD